MAAASTSSSSHSNNNNNNNVDQVQIPMTPLTPMSEEYFCNLFNKADADRDGKITVQELERLITDAELTDEPLPRSVVTRIHQISDTNHDGVLDFPEFVRMVTDSKFKNIFGKFVNRYVNFIVPKRRDSNYVDSVDNLYEDQYSCCPPKIAMILLSIITFIFFLVDELKEQYSTLVASGPMAMIFIYDPAKRYEVWRYLTYMFVHIGHLHLIVNLVVQIFLGVPLEMVHGCRRVLVVYFAGVLAGSLGTSLTDPRTRLAGASGGVYSLITAHIATIILNWSEMSFPAVQLSIFLLITSVDVGTSIYNRYVQDVDEHIGYAAHFAGALAGLLVGINVLRNLKLTKTENVIWWCALVIYIVLMVIAIAWNIFYTDFYPPQV